MNLLQPPDDLTRAGMKRLQGDSDFARFLAWLEHQLSVMDARNRLQQDSVLLRMGQGAARTLDDVIAVASVRSEKSALSNTRYINGAG